MKAVYGEQIDGVDYVRRRCVYGVAIDERGHVLVVRARGKLVLPGGGIEAGETEVAALIRESREESGYTVEVIDELCRARQYVNKPAKSKYRDKDCVFYRMRTDGPGAAPSEANHHPMWLSPQRARAELHHASHRAAVTAATDPQ